jgi:hypothetical protein
LVIPTALKRWLRGHALTKALYQGAPAVYLHRLLSLVGYRGLLGRELNDLANVAQASNAERASLAKSAIRVLFVIPRNFRTHAAFQIGIAQALGLRGADCAVATCGGLMPVCEVTWAERETWPRCARCSEYVREAASLAGLRLFDLNEYRNQASDEKSDRALADLSMAELQTFEWSGLPLGKFAIPPTRWRLRSHEIMRHPDGESVLRGFIRGGIRWAAAMEAVLTAFQPDVLVMLNGLFMAERVTWAIARKRGIRCVFFERGRDAGTVFLSHDQSAPRYDITETWQQVSSQPLDPADRQRIVGLLDRRARGEQMVETYWAAKESDEARIREQLRLRAQRPLAVLFSNVVWDTAMQDRDTLFAGMFDWIMETIRLFQEHPEWDLVMRIHPAETQVPGRESYDRVADWVGETIGTVPDNVRIILPEEPIDSYVLMRMATVGCVYASTVGLEMAAAGVPVVVAGDAHYSRRGFTRDPIDRADYRRCIVEEMSGNSSGSLDQSRELALRYAHVFFLRRMYPMTVLTEPAEARPILAYSSLLELVPGSKPILDLICEGILRGTSFDRDTGPALSAPPA